MTHRHSPEPDDLYARVGKIETDVASLGTTVTGLSVKMDSLGGHLSQITSGLQDLHRQQSSQGRISWGLVASFIGVFLTAAVVVGYVTQFYVESKTHPQAANITALRDRAEMESAHLRELIDLKTQLARYGTESE